MYTYRIYETTYGNVNAIAIDVLYDGKWYRDNLFTLRAWDIEYFAKYIEAISAYATFTFCADPHEAVPSVDVLDNIA